MNLWISIRRAALLKVVGQVDAGGAQRHGNTPADRESSLIKAARACLKLGPSYVFLKRGEHGATLFGRGECFHLPAYPTGQGGGPHRRR